VLQFAGALAGGCVLQLFQLPHVAGALHRLVADWLRLMEVQLHPIAASAAASCCAHGCLAGMWPGATAYTLLGFTACHSRLLCSAATF
jgi:hypothetical protein